MAAPASPATTSRPGGRSRRPACRRSSTPPTAPTRSSASTTAPTRPTCRSPPSPSARTAYSMLLNRGVIRVGLPMPANAEFDLVAVDDPYWYASAKELSLFRRPLPTTNLSFLSAVMWDGRETVARRDHGVRTWRARPTTRPSATRRPSVALTAAQQNSIVAFETALFTAQTSDSVVGSLSAVAGDRRPDVPVEAGVLHRHQRSAGRQPAEHRRSPAPRSRSTTAGPTSPAPARRRRRRRRSRAARTSSTTTRSASPASAGSTTSWASRRSTAPAPPATTRPTSAITRWRCRSTSA